MKYTINLVLAFAALFALAAAENCEVDGHRFREGEEYTPPGTCTLLTCQGDGSYMGKTCADYLAPEDCEMTPQDNSKPYPDCCPDVEC